MLIAHLSMPLHHEPNGHTMCYGVLLTNLEARMLTFRLAFETTVPSALAEVLALLNDHIELGAGAGQPWTGAGYRARMAASHVIRAGETIIVELFNQGNIQSTTALQPLLGGGLRGTTSVMLPTLGDAAQLARPARVAASAYLRPSGLTGQRSFFPPPGGSIEFLVPPDQPANVDVSSAPPGRAAPKRATSRSRKPTRGTRR